MNPQAPRWRRFIAWVIDGTPLLVWALLKQLWQGDTRTFIISNLFIASDFLLLAWTIVNLTWLTTRGQTIGMRLLRIRLVNPDSGENAGFMANVVKRSFLGTLLNIIPFYRPLDDLFVFRKDGRSLRDLLAGTWVVRALEDLQVSSAITPTDLRGWDIRSLIMWVGGFLSIPVFCLMLAIVLPITGTIIRNFQKPSRSGYTVETLSQTPISKANIRIPQTPGEWAQIRQLSQAGPGPCSAWIYGQKSPKTKAMARLTWDDLQLDNKSGCERLIESISGKTQDRDGYKSINSK